MFFLRLAEGGEDQSNLGGSEAALVGGIAGGGQIVEECWVGRHPIAQTTPGVAGRRVRGIKRGQVHAAERSQMSHVAV